MLTSEEMVSEIIFSKMISDNLLLWEVPQS